MSSRPVWLPWQRRSKITWATSQQLSALMARRPDSHQSAGVNYRRSFARRQIAFLGDLEQPRLLRRLTAMDTRRRSGNDESWTSHTARPFADAWLHSWRRAESIIWRIAACRRPARNAAHGRRRFTTGGVSKPVRRSGGWAWQSKNRNPADGNILSRRSRRRERGAAGYSPR